MDAKQYESSLSGIRNNLYDGEAVIDAVPASRLGSVSPGITGSLITTERGALVLTSQRVIYEGTNRAGGVGHFEWLLKKVDDISRSSVAKGSARVSINVSGVLYEFAVEDSGVEKFAYLANKALFELEN